MRPRIYLFFLYFRGIMESILEGLNSEQQRAVSCAGGPMLIVAGAGSGKTRVLTSRIAYLIAGGCSPDRILALTFTKKAASEMKERIGLMVGERKARKIWMGTFHSVFIRFLREYSEKLGYPATFTIYDQGDSVSAVKACIKELGLDEKVYKPKDVLSRISMAKNALVTPAKYAATPAALDNDARAKKPRTCEIYNLYWQKCRQSGVMDFDDILFNMFILLQTDKEARTAIAGRFDNVLVDEYQDTNHAQYAIMRLLTTTHDNVCVVGDDSQSIYSFRGAKIANILNFKKDYPGCKLFRLEQNYRSTQTIVDAANSLIEKNTNRIPKKCFSAAQEGEKITLINSYTDKEEALQIASSIMGRIRQDKSEYKDFAILYRTNSQSRALEEQLRKRNIPYMIYSGNSFFERAEVKDLMAYFKLAANINDDESFKRVINKPARGIGDTSVAAIDAVAHKHSISLFKAACHEDLFEFGIRKAGADKIRAFCEMISGVASKLSETDAYEAATKLAMDSGIWAMYKSDNSIEGQSRLANVEELLDSVKVFVEERHGDDLEEMMAESDVDATIGETQLPLVTLGEYLENVSLLSAVDVDEDDDSGNKVALMTIHSSKGLEFPYVYVAGMEENLFPSRSTLASASEIEEERRLFYVALTRAEKAVALSFAHTRMRNGKTEENAPSRFIREIDSRYILNPLPDHAFDVDEGEADDVPSFLRTPGMGRRPFSGQRRTGSFGGSRQPSSFGSTRQPSSFGGSSSPAPAPRPAFKPQSRPAPGRVPDPDFVPSPVLSLRAGQRIEHNRFGFGHIDKITKEGSDLKAAITFDDYGEKILILKYAKIRIVAE